MCYTEPFDFKTISNNILRTTIIIVISLTNLHKGLTSQTQMDDLHRNEELLKSNKSEIIDGNSATSLLKPSSLSIFLNQKYRLSETYQTGGSSIMNDSPNYVKGMDQETERKFMVAFASKKNEQKLSSGSHASHKVVDLVSPYAEKNQSSNNSNEVLDKPLYNAIMYFGTANSTVVATQIGATAHMSCVVHHLGECVVSWIRKKDYHLLTVGLTAYSSDERFSTAHLKHSEDWTLQIKFVQQRDAGIYECQVSTHPPTSIFLHLLVVEARAEISGPNIRYLTPGSTLRLQCHVVQNTENSEYIFWYHDNRMINYDADRGINVSTEPDFQSSELTISRTRREHSGNYTCVASHTQPASVLVHIFKGDNPAAMYHGHVGSSTKSYQSYLIHNVITLIATVYGSYKSQCIGSEEQLNS